MISKTFVADLVLDTQIRTTFVATQKAVRTTKYGKPYLCVTLGDRTGAIEARAWEGAEAMAAQFEALDFVCVEAEVTHFQDILQLKLLGVEPVAQDQVELGDYLPTSRWNPEAMFAQLKTLILDHVRSPEMTRFFAALFAWDELMDTFKRAPAAKANHHSHIGGLLEHVLSMSRLALPIAAHYQAYYPGLLDKELLLAGCVLHDIGKCRELSFDRGFGYTTHGQLIGHITHGVELVGLLNASLSPALPDILLMQIKHLILSHHGRLEYGSPVVPKTPEAMVLHQIDMIDSRMNMCATLTTGPQAPSGDPEWSPYSRPLETRLYLGPGGQDDSLLPPPELPEGPGLGARDTWAPLTPALPTATVAPTRPKHTLPPKTLSLFGDS